MTKIQANYFWSNLAGLLLMAVLGTVPILTSSMMDRGFEIAKHAFAEPAAFLALAGVALSSGWSWIGRAPLATKFAAACLATFLGLAVLSTLLAESQALAIFGGYYRREGLVAWASYIAFFFAVLGWTSTRNASRLTGLLDLMLLASVVPAAYAIQQRLGLDFFFVVNLDPTRPNGTLGNPIFLGAYLAILLPLTAVRGWQERRSPSLWFWLAVGALQLAALLLTQSRGPLMASLLGWLLLASLAAAYRRAQGVFVAIGAMLVAALAVVVLINTQPAAQRWAQDVPVLSRLVYDLENRGSSAATSLASRSTAARLGIWQAATETFLEAPAASKWIGFGPESSYSHYYPHLPSEVMRVDGYWQSNSYDRFHADTLDIALNYGLLGWLAYFAFFATVFLAAARALFGLGGAATTALFAGLSMAGAGAGAGLAYWVGLQTTMAPAAGLGIGSAWLLFLMACSWRAARRGLPEAARSAPIAWLLLAGLISALLVFWIDAQVNIPVLTTRMISFAIGALVLAVAAALGGPAASEDPDEAQDDLSWGAVLPLVAACASFLPALLLDSTLRPEGLGRWWLFLLPVALLLAFAAARSWTSPQTHGARLAAMRAAIVPAVIAAVVYAVGHWAVAKRIGPTILESDVERLALLGAFGGIFLLGLCVVRARETAVTDTPSSGQPHLLAATPLMVMALLTAWFSWTSIRADVASALANWTVRGQPEVSDRILLAAIEAQPYERQYQRQRTFEYLSRALNEISRRPVSADNLPSIRRDLEVAEYQARAALSRYPGDPWLILALSNVLQVRGLAALRPMLQEEGLAAAQEADRLFASAYKIFPNQPLLLRNWAQLRFNEGDFWGAFRLIDRMEEAIPAELEPYAERIALAQRINDLDVVRETLVRAESRLDPPRMEQLRTVAGLQHEK